MSNSEAGLTYMQAVRVLQTPLGLSYTEKDPAVLAERKRISEKYEELWHHVEGSELARAWWLEEFIRSKRAEDH